MRRRGAGAHRAEARPLDAVFDADMGGGGRGDGAQQRQRMGGLLLVDEEVFIAFLERGEPADARADDRGGARPSRPGR